jgi:hypothetical protein
MFHDKANRIAPLATSKAFKNSFSYRNVERGSPLIVERTEPNHARTAPFQGHKIAYNFLNTGCFNNFVYGFFWNQSLFLEFKINDFFVLKMKRLIITEK